MNATGLVTQILKKIKDARTPERFTQDFLEKSLGFKSGSAKAFIPLAKRLGLLNSDGTPTDLYKKFRNPSGSSLAMAKAIRDGYSELFSSNEKAYQLDKKEFEGLVKQITGLDKSTATLSSICGTFESLKEFANFDTKEQTESLVDKPEENSEQNTNLGSHEEVKLNLSYTINLVLPKTEEITVFNAIFKSLKENLLKK